MCAFLPARVCECLCVCGGGGGSGPRGFSKRVLVSKGQLNAEYAADIRCLSSSRALLRVRVREGGARLQRACEACCLRAWGGGAVNCVRPHLCPCACAHMHACVWVYRKVFSGCGVRECVHGGNLFSCLESSSIGAFTMSLVAPLFLPLLGFFSLCSSALPSQ